jgi:hypothetical protein
MYISLLLPFNVNYHLVAESTFYSKEKKQKEYSIVIVEETKNHYIKHNKTLCNLNVYYLPPISNIF